MGMQEGETDGWERTFIIVTVISIFAFRMLGRFIGSALLSFAGSQTPPHAR